MRMRTYLVVVKVAVEDNPDGSRIPLRWILERIQNAVGHIGWFARVPEVNGEETVFDVPIESIKFTVTVD